MCHLLSDPTTQLFLTDGFLGLSIPFHGKNWGGWSGSIYSHSSSSNTPPYARVWVLALNRVDGQPSASALAMASQFFGGIAPWICVTRDSLLLQQPPGLGQGSSMVKKYKYIFSGSSGKNLQNCGGQWAFPSGLSLSTYFLCESYIHGTAFTESQERRRDNLWRQLTPLPSMHMLRSPCVYGWGLIRSHDCNGEFCLKVDGTSCMYGGGGAVWLCFF